MKTLNSAIFKLGYGGAMQISERGQITIPKRLREQCGLNGDVELSPIIPPSDILERLAAERHLTLATKNLSDVMKKVAPIEIPPGEQSPSERLAELRRDER